MANLSNPLRETSMDSMQSSNNVLRKSDNELCNWEKRLV